MATNEFAIADSTFKITFEDDSDVMPSIEARIIVFAHVTIEVAIFTNATISPCATIFSKSDDIFLFIY